MIPGKWDLKLYRGDTGKWRFTLWQDVASGTPADLTGVEAASEIRDKPGGTVIVVLACTVTQPNIIDVELDAADSVNTPAKGVWDLQLTYPSGTVATVLGGAVTTTPDVTDSVAAQR